jgi:hypothetical protein
VEPDPRLRVDGLADGAEEAQGAEVPRVGQAVGEPRRQRPHERRGRVVGGHAVALDDLEVPAGVRGVGGALVDHLREPVRQRAVDLVGVGGDPGEVGRAPVHVVGLRVEDGPVGPARGGEVAAARVHEALRLPRRAARVHDEERGLGVERLRLVGVGLRVDEVVPPQVAALRPRHVGGLVARAPHDEHVLDLVLAAHGVVGGGLDRYRASPTELPVGGHEQLRPRVLDAELQRLAREPAEDERVDRPDPGDRERDDDRLGDHGEVDDDAVALADAEAAEPVRGLHDLALQLRVGDVAAVAGLALDVQGDLLAAAGRHVPVDAVDGDVEAAAGEPGRLGHGEAAVGQLLDRAPGVGGVPGGLPVEAVRLLLPEGDRVGRGARVLGARDVRRRREGRRGGEGASLVEQVRDRVAGGHATSVRRRGDRHRGARHVA